MSEDHFKSQESIITWATHCIKGLSEQNARLETIVEQQSDEIQTLAYNLQGFENSRYPKPEKPTFEANAPGLYKTKTPKIIQDAGEIGEMAEGDPGLFFHTSTGAEVELTEKEHDPESRAGGPIKLLMALDEVIKGPGKSQAQRDQALFRYKSAGSFDCPAAPAKRWQWAIKKVIRSLRVKNLKVGLNRGRLPHKDTIAAQLSLLDHKVFEIPIHLREHVKEREIVVNKRVDTEVETLNTSLEEQKKEYTAMGEKLQGSIDVTNQRVGDIDKRLVKLQEQVDNGNKQLDEIELKLSKVIARVNTEEAVLFDSIKARIQESSEKIVSLKTGGGIVTALMEKLNQMNADTAPCEYENDSDKMDAESKKLFDMLKFETVLRNARSEISLLDNNAFTLNEQLRHIRREVLALSVLAGGDYEAIIPKALVNELLALVDSGTASISDVNETITTATALWGTHDSVLSERWDVLAGVVETVQGMANITDEITAIRTTMDTLPTEARVTEIGTEIVTASLEPVQQSIEEVDRNALKGVGDVSKRVDEVDAAWQAGIKQLDVDMRDTFNAIQVQRTEMRSAGGDGGGEGGGEGSAVPGGMGGINIEGQLEPMIKDIVEMYVQHPPIRPKSDAAETRISDFFALQSAPEGPDGPVEDIIFDMDELSLVFNSSKAPFDDEILDDGEAPEHVAAGATEMVVGALVKIVNQGSKFYRNNGIITAIVDESGETLTEGGPAEEAANEEKAPEGGNQEGVVSAAGKRARYRVAVTPKTPKEIQGDSYEDAMSFEAGMGGDGGEGDDMAGALKPSGSQGRVEGFNEMQKQVHMLTQKVEEITRSLTGEAVQVGEGGRGGQAHQGGPGRSSPFMAASSEDSRGASPVGSPITSHKSTSHGFGASGSPTAGHTSTSAMDSTAVMDIIQSSLLQVSDEIGDLRETSQRELSRAKDAMKKAIMVAINKAIVEQAEKDKPAMLSTKSLCMGCGRPSLVRALPFSQDLIANGFNPALNENVQAGPDIYRAGFRMPVNKNNTVAKLHGGKPGGPKVFSQDSLFERGGVHEEESMANTLNTYSEILANIDTKTQLKSIKDVGPGGMSISITSTTAPIRQLSYPARNIRHAQGKEEAAMLKPIHRKGFPGKTSERARAAVNKTWTPERFDDNFALSPKAVSVPRPLKVPTSGALSEGSVDSKFQP